MSERPDTVELVEVGGRMDKQLSTLLAVSRAEVQRLLTAGRIRHNGQAVERRSRLPEGAILEIDWPPIESRVLLPQDLALEVLYEDEAMRVINKPPGMVVHPGDGTPDGTLVNGLLHLEPELAELSSDRPGIVHRLDKETSGVIVTARTNESTEALQAMFAKRRTTKIYLALTKERPRAQSPMTESIARHPRHRQKMAIVEDGKRAVTHFRLLAASPEAHLWVIRIETGRTHQIRVHFAAAGAPILGDGVYGRRRVANLAPRQMLHAWQLTLKVDGEPLTVKAPLPADFCKLAESLGIDLGALSSPDAAVVGEVQEDGDA